MPIAIQQTRLDNLTEQETIELLYMWKFWARSNQLPPTNLNWYVWLLLAGRGFGKTRVGAEFIRDKIENHGFQGRIHLIAATAADVRDIMVEGESGILACSPPWNRPKYEPSKRRLTWPNGAQASTFSADEPDRLRGPQCHLIWADELAAWRYPEAWDMAMFGLRLKAPYQREPQAVVTTTPRPVIALKELLQTAGTVVTKGTTYDNRANLAAGFFETIIRKYEGTRLGRQELKAELLEDTPGALWNWDDLDADRIRGDKLPELMRIGVAIDPAVSSDTTSNETGIIAAGLGVDNEVYVLGDVSGIYTPYGWAMKACDLYDDLKADRIIGEANNGGDLIEANLRTIDRGGLLPIAYRKVYASRGKRIRAEPVAALYEQHKVHHVGSFNTLEEEMTSWDSTDPRAQSPNRVDALLWIITALGVIPQLKRATSYSGGGR